MLVGNELTPVSTKTQKKQNNNKNKMYFCVENELYISLSEQKSIRKSNFCTLLYMSVMIAFTS